MQAYKYIYICTYAYVCEYAQTMNRQCGATVVSKQGPATQEGSSVTGVLLYCDRGITLLDLLVVPLVFCVSHEN